MDSSQCESVLLGNSRVDIDMEDGYKMKVCPGISP